MQLRQGGMPLKQKIYLVPNLAGFQKVLLFLTDLLRNVNNLIP
jgi:hypothetical protein